ncbi:hypothetical protein CRV08_12675 [Halarcobacter ebronensis]|uniref:Histidine kinase n=1 Tax=Halarcobacter ebronensis TaxID=1462615 RepID=A0A4Q0Y8A7_9BACT|nr:transporter substrate-binding domain-containing protein [Halarcobacter ebronensis]RXJ66467.1 hypothetical protein CRV08_12675 [Halarcobacter ebronensis]
MSNFIKIFLIIAITLSSLFSNEHEEEASHIELLTSNYLYNYDTQGLLNVAKSYLKSHKQIKALEIFDSVENSRMLTYYKDADKTFFNKPLPKFDSNITKHSFPIKYKDEIVGNATIYFTNQNSLDLSQEELQWLKTHPKIKVHNELNWIPINFNKEGIPSGFSVEFMNLLAKKIGIKVEYVQGEWNELYNKAINKQIDVMLNIIKTDEREKFLLFTQTYQKGRIGIFTLKNNHSITDINSLSGKKVAVVDGFFQENLIKEKYPLVQVIVLKNAQETLYALEKGEADAAIGSYIVMGNLIKELSLYELEYRSELEIDEDTDLRIAVRNDYTLLHSILQKAIANVGSQELNALREKWIGTSSATRANIFSRDELQWIKEHGTINVGGELDWAPFDFVDENNQYNGLAKDYLDLISSISGLNFKINTGKSWNELLLLLKDGKIDLLPAIYYNEARAKDVIFTSPYLAIADYYITKKALTKLDNIETLYGKNVAVVKGYDITTWLKEEHKKIKLIEFDSIIEALRSVESGETVAFLNDNPSSTYAIEKNFISTLKINNLLKERAPTSLHMAVKKEYKILAEIINKSIKEISREDKKLISNKWMSTMQKRTSLINFNEKEILWLSKKPVIKFAVDPNWIPIEGINKKTQLYEGMMADYLSLIKEHTGIEFQLISTENWTQSMQLAKEGRVHMLAAASKTPQREKFLNFSKTTFTLTDGVIMNSNANFISKVSDLKGLRVGLSEGTSLYNLIKDKYPELNLVPIKGTKEGIDKLRNGLIDAYIGNLEVISHIIFTNNILNLKVALKLDNRRDIHIAIRKDYPNEAITAINKAIDIISEDEINLIRKKWVGLKIDEGIDYILVAKVALIIIVIFLIVIYYNRKLQHLVDKKTKDLQEQKLELENLISQFDKNVIFSKTDLDGIITHASDAFCKISGYSYDELIGKPHNIFRHPDMPQEIFTFIWESLKKETCVKVEMKNKNKNGTTCWFDTKLEPDYNKDGKHIGYSAIRVDITDKKRVQRLSESLEQKVIERTKELDSERKYINSVMNSQENLVVSTNGYEIKTANKAFLKFFNVENIEEFKNRFGNCISDTFDNNSSDEFIKKVYFGKKWNEYILETPNIMHKTKITVNNESFIFSIGLEKFKHGEEYLQVAALNDITELENIRVEVEQMHKHTQDSIEYASLIQHSLIPPNDTFKKYFSDYFAIWHPKDIVGGDIYLLEDLRNDNECILMVIDCTGHGVPGAFVSMLVKAIERQITSKILNSQEEVSPGKILSIFNRSMKHLLKQEDNNSISNAGFDGGIIYYNKKESIIKFAGAEIPLYYIDENREYHMIKGSRQSVGYKKSDANFDFEDHIIKVKKDMQFYIATDGYVDQIGGKEGFSFNKKRFQKLIEEIKDESFADQQELLLDNLHEYQGDEIRCDDITLVGFKIS